MGLSNKNHSQNGVTIFESGKNSMSNPTIFTNNSEFMTINNGITPPFNNFYDHNFQKPKMKLNKMMNRLGSMDKKNTFDIQ